MNDLSGKIMALAQVLFVASVAMGQTVASSTSDLKNHPSLKRLWPAQPDTSFHQALEHGIGFSFVLDGQQVGREVPADANVITRNLDGAQEAVFRHPSGLVAVQRCRVFPQFDAVEYTVRFRNESADELPLLEKVNALDVTFRGQELKDLSLVSDTPVIPSRY